MLSAVAHVQSHTVGGVSQTLLFGIAFVAVAVLAMIGWERRR